MSPDIKKVIVGNRVYIAAACLVVLVVLLTVMPRTKTTEPVKSEAPVKNEAPVSGSKVYDGSDWALTGNLKISDQDKAVLKLQAIKITLDGSILHGNPVITTQRPMSEYMAFVDKFYSLPENRNIPVFFAVKMADMKFDGAPDNIVNSYKLVVEKKLRSAGIL